MTGIVRQTRTVRLVMAMATLWLAVTLVTARPHATPAEPLAQPRLAGGPDPLFLTSHECLACHNGLTSPIGEDVSIGPSWRASMMANSSRDPYWQAAVRRELIDHPAAAGAIEHECSICHMPMARTTAGVHGRRGRILAHLPIGAGTSNEDVLAADGVSCTLCHQIAPDRLGTRESFTGGFVIGPGTGDGGRRIFGPFEIEQGQRSVMRSATGMTPAAATHLRESAACATCHTLYTHALGPDGEAIGELPEQVPFLEWRHSAWREERSCQSCHMPEVQGPVRLSSVLGKERPRLNRHTFTGGNFFVLRMLNRHRAELGVEALPQELEAAAAATIALLERSTASLAIAPFDAPSGARAVEVTVGNLTGHKLPTAYPSRRVWLHLTVRDSGDRLVFRSGAIEPSGLIRGNDNDRDAARFEPHYAEIRREDEVQIYESIMHDATGAVTTGLLRASGYAKDNRLLPRGFDKATAPADIAVAGRAAEDDDFAGGGDRVRYVVDVSGHTGPFRVDVELRYQSIGFRWARNLQPYDAPEPRRFVRWFDALATGTSVVLARTAATIP